MGRRMTVLLVVVVMMMAPVAASAAGPPVDGAAAWWVSLGDWIAGLGAGWGGAAETTAASEATIDPGFTTTAAEPTPPDGELGPWPDPDGITSEDDPGFATTAAEPTPPDGELGPWVDPDGITSEDAGGGLDS